MIKKISTVTNDVWMPDCSVKDINYKPGYSSDFILSGESFLLDQLRFLDRVIIPVSQWGVEKVPYLS